MAKEKINGNAQGLQEALIDDKEFFKEMIRGVCQNLMEEELAAFLGAEAHERTEERRGYRNGYKPRILRTRVGDIGLLIPKDRDGNFSTKLFSRYQRSEKALVLSIAEMYIQGVSTRNVTRIAEELLGASISKSQVSRDAPGHWTRTSWPLRCALSESILISSLTQGMKKQEQSKELKVSVC